MNICPNKIYEATVVAWAIVGPGVTPTRKTAHSVDGLIIEPAAGLAIVQSTDGRNYYLFSCDSSWNELVGTRHSTIEEAKRQAEFEYEGISSRWHDSPEPPQ